MIAMALSGMVTTAARPGLQALLAGLSRNEAERADATAAWSALDSAGFLLGAGLAGATMALAGAAVVCAGAGLAATTSAVLVGSLSSPVGDPSGDAGPGPRPLDGLRTVLGTSALHVPVVLLTGLLLLEGTTDVQLVAVSRELRLGDGGPGLMFCLWGTGGVLSSLVIRQLVARRGYGPAMTAGAIGFGAALGLAGLSGAAVTLAAMPLIGLGFGLVETGVMGIIPELCDQEALGRVYGLTEVIYGGAVAVGVAFAPALITAFGASRSVALVGVTFAFVTALACVSARRAGSLSSA